MMSLMASNSGKATIKMDKDADKVAQVKDLDYDDGMETGSCTSMGGEEEEAERVNLADKETAAVFRLRLLVLLVLLLAAVAVSVIVYFITTTAQKKEYKNQYDGAAKKVVESFQDIMDSKLGAVSSMGVAIIGECSILRCLFCVNWWFHVWMYICECFCSPPTHFF